MTESHRHFPRPTPGFACILFVSVLTLAAFFSTACAEEPPFTASEVPNAPRIEIPNAKRPFPGILTGGQPTPEQLRMAQQNGFKTIVNLRPRSEQGEWDEASTAAELGLRYISIPVAGAAGVSAANARYLIEALDDPTNYPVLVHCASGNRVGALFAIDAGKRRGKNIDEAVEIGRSAGLTRLEPRVRELLQ